MSWDSGRVRRAEQGPVPFLLTLGGKHTARFLGLFVLFFCTSIICDPFACPAPRSFGFFPLGNQWVGESGGVRVNKMSQMLGPGRGPTLSAFEQHWLLPHLGRKLSELFAHQHTSPVGNQCFVLLPDAATRIPDPAPIPNGHWRVLCHWP